MATNEERKPGQKQEQEEPARGQPQHEDAEFKRQAADRSAGTPERPGQADEEGDELPPRTPVAGP